MAVSAVNNTAAFTVYVNYARNSDELKRAMGRMSTGTKSVVDDPSGIAISERMRSQAEGTAMARNNVENAVSLLQTADGWLQKVSDMISRMSELAVSARDGTKTSSDIANVQTEFEALQDEIKRITENAAKFNGRGMLDGTLASGVTTQIGADTGQTIELSIDDLRSNATTDVDPGGGTVEWGSIIDSGKMSVTSAPTLNALVLAINHVANTRASIGAQQSRLTQTFSGLLTYEDNLREAESKIRDVDMARESAEMTKYQILTQVSNAMLAQANQLPSQVLQLLG